MVQKQDHTAVINNSVGSSEKFVDVEGRNGGWGEEGLPSIWCDLMAWIQK